MEEQQRLQLSPRFEQALAQAEKLVSSAETTILHPLAHTKRRFEGGHPVDIEQTLQQVEGALATVASQIACFPSADQESTPVSVDELAETYWQHVTKQHGAASTGFSRLNELLGGGLEPQRLMVLLGAPGGGKTTFANQLAVQLSQIHPVLYVTTEDSPFTLFAKTLARLGQIDYRAVLKGAAQERERIQETLDAYRSGPGAHLLWYLDASSLLESEQIKQHAQVHFARFQAEGRHGVVIVDYLQRLARAQLAYRGGTFELRQAVTTLTEQLKQMAITLNCCVLALASQHRAGGYGAANSALATAKESGDIEYTADVVMALGEDEKRSSSVTWLQPRMLRLDKNRQGEGGVVALDWYGERQQFTEAQVASSATASPGAKGNKRSS